MIKIDGGSLSGSGTIVRYSAALAVVLGKNLLITNIRAKRPKPGLRRQHLTAIQACARFSGGHVEGAEVGSKEILFRPGSFIIPGHYLFDIGSAGAVTLLGYTLLIPALLAPEPCRFILIGGLFQDFAPTAYHFKYCLLPLLERMGASVETEIVRPGYVPEGKGRLDLTVQPAGGGLMPFSGLERGQFHSVKIMALASHLSGAQVGARMAEACEKTLRREGFTADSQIVEDSSAPQKGAALLTWGVSDTGAVIGSDMAGARGRSSEKIGRSTANRLIRSMKSGAYVDAHLADQLVIFAAMAEGVTRYTSPEITDHIETNLWLVEEILGAKTSVQGNVIEIEGVGIDPGNSPG